MSELREISDWDWPDTVRSKYAYDDERRPELTAENLAFLAKKINEIIGHLNPNE